MYATYATTSTCLYRYTDDTDDTVNKSYINTQTPFYHCYNILTIH